MSLSIYCFIALYLTRALVALYVIHYETVGGHMDEKTIYLVAIKYNKALQFWFFLV